MSLKEESPTPILNSTTNTTSTSTNFGMIKPTNENETSRLAMIDDLKLFLATAANNWDTTSSPLKRFHLSTGESISCVLWNGLYFVTGTDIVRSLTFRFQAFGRPITNAKKFEEGIFSDLRNLKPGIDARLEEPKSDLLDMLYKNNCIRTQKKQKVFFWYSVPHDRLFLDALERDLKREKMGLEPTTTAVAEPATSTSLDTTQELFDQLRKSMSISAAATAHALEEEVNNANSSSLDTTMSQDSPSPTLSSTMDDQHLRPVMMPTSSKTTTFIDPGLSERIQTRRSRVNSVPADFGQDGYLQQHLVQQQQKQQRQRYRMSHGSYFAPPSSLATRQHRTESTTSSPSSARFNERRPSSSLSFTSSSSQDTLVDGVHQLDIANRQRKQPRTSHHHHQASHANQHHHHHHQQQQQQKQQQHRLSNGGVLPSKSLDSNTIKKTKTIFGALSLFDGSPTYKQRRRRATSVSSSGLQQPQPQQKQPVGGPDRIRRHANCHLRTSSTASSVHSGSATSSSSSAAAPVPTSRLAMAAMAAGFGNGGNRPQQYPSRYQGSFMFMQQQPPTDLVMTPSWSAMMDTPFGGMEEDSLSATSSHPLLNNLSCEYCGKFFQCSTLLDQHRKAHDSIIGVQQDDYMVKDETDDDTDDPHYHYHHQHHHRSTSSSSTVFETPPKGPPHTIHATNHDSSMYQHYGKNDVLGTSSTTLLSRPTEPGACMLSPVEDMEMKDVVLSVDTYHHPYSSPFTSPGQHSDQNTTPIETGFSTHGDFMVSYGMSPKDEVSSASSSSSPSSILHYQSYYDMLAPQQQQQQDGPVLLSPFKPDLYSSSNQGLSDLFPASSSYYPPLMTSSFCTTHHDYTPLTTTNDMTTVFN